MQIRKEDENQFWLTYEYKGEMWSRAHPQPEAESFPNLPGLKVLKAYRITTHADGSVDMTPLKSLDELRS